MALKDIMNIVPMVQSASLVNENVKFLNKKKVKTKDIVKLGTKNIVGVNLIKAESDIIGTL
jgi:hypothetical protein